MCIASQILRKQSLLALRSSIILLARCCQFSLLNITLVQPLLWDHWCHLHQPIITTDLSPSTIDRSHSQAMFHRACSAQRPTDKVQAQEQKLTIGKWLLSIHLIHPYHARTGIWILLTAESHCRSTLHAWDLVPPSFSLSDKDPLLDENH